MLDLIKNDYEPAILEPEVQNYWHEKKVFKASEESEKTKFYCLSMFPYPSGRLHMGHVRNYTIGDVISRFKRLSGFNVMQPMGWDAFGLPAENAAIDNNVEPCKWTYDNIDYMRGQLKALGFSYDWDREFATCDPDYYKWEQWFFKKMYSKGLVYKEDAEVNWDPVDETVLANEQVIDGKGWRSGATIERRRIPQWYLKITDYADELLSGLRELDEWPESVKTMQRNWIGRSQGLLIEFSLSGGRENKLEVFTTRPDTLMGATYLAVAPDHPLAIQVAKENEEVNNFISENQDIPISQSQFDKMEKKGVSTGLLAIHPLTGSELPIWVANFVLMGYGTGAVMSVPAHDYRDWEFAKKYGLSIQQVVVPSGGTSNEVLSEAFVEKGILINSGPFDGLDFQSSFEAIERELKKNGKAKKKIQYRLRDWLISRQRYWGCPIPMIQLKSGDLVSEDDENLPVLLPTSKELESFSSGSLLDSDEFRNVSMRNGEIGKREKDTFDTFFESSWYFARFCSYDASNNILDQRARYWLPVDIYIGGIEHAVLHLLYARFFFKAMRDEGLVSGDEPFKKLLTQGMVCKETYFVDSDDGKIKYFRPEEVLIETDAKGKPVKASLKSSGVPVKIGPVEKMSKSKNNGVDPDALIKKYGADTVRLYTMFASPPEQSLEWSDSSLEGSFRFIKSLWKLVQKHLSVGELRGAIDVTTLAEEEEKIRRRVHQTISKVSDDFDRRLKFNTAIASVMELCNLLQKFEVKNDNGRHILQEALESVVILMSPITPHVCEVLWSSLGKGKLIEASWPVPDQSAMFQDSVTIVVQVNGKKRATLTLSVDEDEEAYKKAALRDSNITKYIYGKELKKIIVVPKKLVNIVIA